MKIQSNFSLKDKNTLGIVSIAKYYIEVNDEKDLIKAIQFSHDNKLSIHIIGTGSNILLPSSGIGGVVIKLNNQKCEYLSSDGKEYVIIGAGCLLPIIIPKLSMKKYDLSCFVGYPSSIGGAIYGNSGTRDSSLSNYLKSAIIYDIETMKKEEWQKEDFNFDYRYSKLKNNKNKIFFEGIFMFPVGNNIQEKISQKIEERSLKQPRGKSAGCIFKNPTKENNNPKEYSAGYLIEQCGLKGEKIGGAYISEKHANFFMNNGIAISDDFMELINLAQTRVKEKFGIELELEIEIFN